MIYYSWKGCEWIWPSEKLLLPGALQSAASQSYVNQDVSPEPIKWGAAGSFPIMRSSQRTIDTGNTQHLRSPIPCESRFLSVNRIIGKPARTTTMWTKPWWSRRSWMSVPLFLSTHALGVSEKRSIWVCFACSLRKRRGIPLSISKKKRSGAVGRNIVRTRGNILWSIYPLRM